MAIGQANTKVLSIIGLILGLIGNIFICCCSVILFLY